MKYTKWCHPARNNEVGYLFCVHQNTLIPTKLPLARVVSVLPGEDGFIRVATWKTARGIYKCPVTKIAVLLSNDPH